jgi:nicotinic acid mononucleotide adenylyltransferase
MGAVELTETEEWLRSIDLSLAPAVARFDAVEALTGRIAVLPSAFNPPTIAHLHLLEQALDVEGVTAAAAMLSTRNVAKGVVGAGLADRVGMLLAAREDANWLVVLAVNAARLVDQAAALTEAYPGAEFDFVVGFDTLVRLFDRVYYNEMELELEPFFARHRVIATNRADAGIERVREFVKAEAGPFQSRIVAIEIDEGPASMSSTAAREAVANGLPPGEAPSSVLAYIKRRGLYQAPINP